MPPKEPASQITSLSATRCQDLTNALQTEWLETDGRGGFAASTIRQCPTRRYHGLLVAPVPTADNKRHLFLARYDEFVDAGSGDQGLGFARFDTGDDTTELASPQGFELQPWPKASYAVGAAVVTREVLMPRGSAASPHGVLTRYSLAPATAAAGEGSVTLTLRPVFACREADALTVQNDVLDPRTEAAEPHGIRFRPYASLPAVTIRVEATAGDAVQPFSADPMWHNRLQYDADLARGYDGHEDQFSPGSWRIRLQPGESVVLAATLGDGDALLEPTAMWQAATAGRRQPAPVKSGIPAIEPRAQSLFERVAPRADDFLYTARGGRAGVLAGFPWFGEWGRDVFIALPGLTISRGRVDQCEQVLSGALEYLQDGLLPNIYELDIPSSHYGSVDAALWFARAVRLYEVDGGSRERVLEEYLPALIEIAESYLDGAGIAGTKLGIRANDELLIEAGREDLNPTWMDAQTSRGPVTPRQGCAVEICALWYSLLAHLETLLQGRGDRARRKVWKDRRQEVGRSFLKRFWLNEGNYLADRWHEGRADASVRPNMVLAAALEFSPLSRAQRRGVLDRAQSELLTPRGLRTLEPSDPDYCGRYHGDPDQRDGAYHQGTAWPWLLGFYVEAATRARGNSPKLRSELLELWLAFESELDRAGLDHVSEVFDGDDPQRPGGTFAQAWNTAELLRSLALLSR